MISLSKNVYIEKLHDAEKEHNTQFKNQNESSEVKRNTYTEYILQNNKRNLKFHSGD